MTAAKNRKTNRKKIGENLATAFGANAVVKSYIPHDDEIDLLGTPLICVDSKNSDTEELDTNMEVGSFSYYVIIFQRVDREAGITAEIATDNVDDLEQVIRTYVKEHDSLSGFWDIFDWVGASDIIDAESTGGKAYRTERIEVRTRFSCNT